MNVIFPDLVRITRERSMDLIPIYLKWGYPWWGINI